jgi:hypothetical protein
MERYTGLYNHLLGLPNDMKTASRFSLLALILGLIFCRSLAAEPSSEHKAPVSAKDREELLSKLRKFQGFGARQWTETSRLGGRRILVVWYCPFSGRGSVFVHGYYYDDAKWSLFLDRFLDVEDLSVELPAGIDAVRLRGPDGKVLLTESLSKLPRAKQDPRQ